MCQQQHNQQQPPVWTPRRQRLRGASASPVLPGRVRKAAAGRSGHNWLPRHITDSARVNLNLYWDKLEEYYLRRERVADVNNNNGSSHSENNNSISSNGGNNNSSSYSLTALDNAKFHLATSTRTSNTSSISASTSSLTASPRKAEEDTRRSDGEDDSDSDVVMEEEEEEQDKSETQRVSN